MTIIIGIHIAILACASGLIALLLHYQKNYSLPGGHTRIVSAAFLIVIGMLMIAATILLFFVPWHYVPEFFNEYITTL